MIKLEKIINIDDGLYLFVDITETKELIKFKNDLKKEQNIDYINGAILLNVTSKSLIEVDLYDDKINPHELSGNILIFIINYLYNNKLTNNNFIIKTRDTEKEVYLNINKYSLETIAINMGKPTFTPRNIPVKSERNIFVNESINIGNNNYNTTCLSIGEPHAVIISKDIDSINLKEVGSKLEFYPMFPKRTNVDLVEKFNSDFIYNRTWRRGNGEVPICINGACASAVAMVLNGYVDYNKDIKLISKGGILKVRYNTNEDVIVTKDIKLVKKK